VFRKALNSGEGQARTFWIFDPKGCGRVPQTIPDCDRPFAFQHFRLETD
jgi:hypothetical protein